VLPRRSRPADALGPSSPRQKRTRVPQVSGVVFGPTPRQTVYFCLGQLRARRDFGRDVRNLMNSIETKRSSRQSRRDSQARGLGQRARAAAYFATGVGWRLDGPGCPCAAQLTIRWAAWRCRSEHKPKRSTMVYRHLLQPAGKEWQDHRYQISDATKTTCPVALWLSKAWGGDQRTVVELKAVSRRSDALWPEKSIARRSRALRRTSARRTGLHSISKNPHKGTRKIPLAKSPRI